MLTILGVVTIQFRCALVVLNVPDSARKTIRPGRLVTRFRIAAVVLNELLVNLMQVLLITITLGYVLYRVVIKLSGAILFAGPPGEAMTVRPYLGVVVSIVVRLSLKAVGLCYMLCILARYSDVKNVHLSKYGG